MKPYFFTKSLATLLVIALVAPATFFIAPKKASAANVSCIAGLVGGLIAGGISKLAAVPNDSTVENGTTGGTQGATVASCIYEAILVPLAKAMIRAMLQKLTASVISWINNTPGKGGKSAPSFVTNISVNLQGVGDAVAGPFFNQIATALNSPFGASISSALKVSYSQNTSMAGFFAANQNTLARSSPNPTAFLNGQWSQGGVAAWFSLTTQDQNNPYTLYQKAQSQLSNNVGQAQATRKQDITQSGGFLSWCGVTDEGTTNANSAAEAYQACIAGCNYEGYTEACAKGCVGNYQSATGTTGAKAGVNPGDACYNSDGTPGKVQTPGSIMHDYTQKAVVASGFDQLISAKDLDDALGSIVNALVSQVIGGATGLLGASQSSPSSSRPAFTSQLQSYTPSNTAVSQSSLGIAQASLDRSASYKSTWNVILATANKASASLSGLASFCTAAATANPENQTFVAAATAQASAATQAITTTVSPVIAQANESFIFAENLKKLAESVSAKAVAVPTPATLGDDIQKLATEVPTLADLSEAQRMASATGGATASPAGSLSVSRGTLMDQLNLLIANAEGLKASVCTAPATPASVVNGNAS